MEDVTSNRNALRSILAGWMVAAAFYPMSTAFGDDPAEIFSGPSSAWLQPDPAEELDPVEASSESAKDLPPWHGALLKTSPAATAAAQSLEPLAGTLSGPFTKTLPPPAADTITEPAPPKQPTELEGVRSAPPRSLAIREPVRPTQMATVDARQVIRESDVIARRGTASPSIAVEESDGRSSDSAQLPTPIAKPTATATIAVPPIPSLQPSGRWENFSPRSQRPEPVISWTEQAERDRWQHRQTVAHRVSLQILGDAPERSMMPPEPNVSTITARRLAEQAAIVLDESRAQAGRGTPLSAIASATEALRLIAEANDLLDGSVTSASYLAEAQDALREASDFSGRFGPVNTDALQRMIESHQTPILKSCDVSQLTGTRAADIYFDFARERFAAVAQANPIATGALVVLADAHGDPNTVDATADAVVVSLLRAAVQAMPNDPTIANELGYQLLQQGLLGEAQWALEHSYALRPTLAAGRNLAETYRQQGNLPAAQQVIAGLRNLPPQGPTGPQILTLPVDQFAAISRPTSPPDNRITAPPPMPTATNPAANQPSVPRLAPTPALAVPVQPAESKGPIGRVADAVSRLWN